MEISQRELLESVVDANTGDDVGSKLDFLLKMRMNVVASLTREFKEELQSLLNTFNNMAIEMHERIEREAKEEWENLLENLLEKPLDSEQKKIEWN